MSLLNIGLAALGDDEGLRKLIRQTEMEGRIRVSFIKEPSYFEALEVQGASSDVVIAKNGRGEIVGAGNRSIKTLFLNGHPAPVGYLSGLRLMKEYRHGTALLRGYRFLEKLNEDKRAGFYLSTIVEDNSAAMKALTKRRRGMPVYKDLGRFYTMVINLRQRTRIKKRDDFSIRTATANDVNDIEALLLAEGRKKQFFPVYSAEDILDHKGLLRGLKETDILLAVKKGELLGVVAAWDQSEFRQVFINGYQSPLCYTRPFYNLFARWSGYPFLPNAGSPLGCFYLSLICIKENDEKIFQALVVSLFERYRSRYPLMMCGLHEKDPLLNALMMCRHFAYKSRLYLVYWDDLGKVPLSIDKERIPYLELGAL